MSPWKCVWVLGSQRATGKQAHRQGGELYGRGEGIAGVIDEQTERESRQGIIMYFINLLVIVMIESPWVQESHMVENRCVDRCT